MLFTSKISNIICCSKNPETRKFVFYCEKSKHFIDNNLFSVHQENKLIYDTCFLGEKSKPSKYYMLFIKPMMGVGESRTLMGSI